ncbi:energy transducer TonB [Brevundimonas sp. S30B]|uniref:energy transducer TonB n=1 Tax=unclassified Brevundimonas TaxID=2622653 RepID=UPI001072E0B5|nr:MULTISPECIES: energy transducer TonB [unclassified Brevundimonas]QBX37765.1 energy transducer TonB [Brevundimonas sp. MF30-B]TFW02881.1 energy transducer TonB [Brevundimonas sp. S30B]
MRARAVAAWAVVAALHGGVALYLNRTHGQSPAPSLAPIEVVLFRPPPEPIAPPAEPEPAASEGGGAPAAPSRVRPTPRPPAVPVELAAPPEPAPDPDPVIVGQAPIAGPVAGQGQGGEGTGTGGGTGSGVGPGSGGRFQVLRGPTLDERRRAHPPAALRAGRSGRAAMSCIIGLDERLSDCRIVSETPEGQGFGPAALTLAPAFRARPPILDGRAQPGTRGVFGVIFGRDG